MKQVTSSIGAAMGILIGLVVAGCGGGEPTKDETCGSCDDVYKDTCESTYDVCADNSQCDLNDFKEAMESVCP